jgi:hypothetical protein
MKVLYIIGNGFDLHHGLNTHLHQFSEFIKHKNIRLYDYLHTLFEDKLYDNEWKQFEEHLSTFGIEAALEANSNYLSDDIYDNSYEIENNRLYEELTTGLRTSFCQFILQANKKELKPSLFLNIENAHFLSFNYTNTLERAYLIPHEKITYLHGQVINLNSDIILGHGTEPSLHEELKIVEPIHKSYEDKDRWDEWQASIEDPAQESAIELLNCYFKDSFKDTTQIISQNSELFNSLSDVIQIFVLGHSLSDLDLPYFQFIANSVHSNCHWNISHYWDGKIEHERFSEYFNHKETIESLNIRTEQITMFKLSDS